MPVTIRPPRPLRERILGYGGPKCGKSRGLVSVMARVPDQAFHIIDNDASYERMIYSDEFADKLEHRVGAEEHGIHLYDVDEGDWLAHMVLVDEVAPLLLKNDWFGIDLMTPTWSVAILNWYDHLIFGVDDHSGYAMQMRKALEDQRTRARDANAKENRTQPLYDDFRDWGTINPEYRKLYSKIKKINATAHVYLTAEEQLIGNNDKAEVKELFGHLNYKARGQNAMGHLTHTVIRFHTTRDGYVLSTAGDRQRELLEEEPYEDFARTYLMGTAGWKVKKTDE